MKISESCEAASYVGVSAQTLRRWDRDGTLSAVRRPGSNYRYYRQADLEPFRLQYRRAEEAAASGADSSVFATANADVEANASCGNAARSTPSGPGTFLGRQESAIVQIPVGAERPASWPHCFGIAKGESW
ncbi:MerR family DNA-binding transcriptional regulator [Rhodococcus sp. NJ-530]|uniref:MerR family transcriptional regulator n=1 Tax=Rhodococcus sp. NJ-530 TaxID=2490853 RepID=UPI000F61B071|nr:MerR family DNA-binding transcriptional regulator [Rhodococcus sp. NJ-530]AZI65642.1 MerR family DNA-binding transcriptional regulator [Rhodococcus sp. NJ-530]